MKAQVKSERALDALLCRAWSKYALVVVGAGSGMLVQEKEKSRRESWLGDFTVVQRSWRSGLELWP